MKSCVSALSDPNRAVGAAGLAECHGVTAADGHLDGLQDHLKRASEAVDREINLIAGRVGLSIWDLQDTADAAASPLKAKGVGELGLCGVAAAVANAVHNATGIRVRDYPVTMDRLIGRLPAIG